MPLPQQSLLDTKMQTTPAELARLLREEGPFFHWERGGFWVVTDFRLAEHVLKSPDYTADRSAFFVSRMPDMDLRLLPDFFGVVKQMMVMSDTPRHAPRRKLASMGLSEEGLERFASQIERTVAERMDQVEKRGEGDFVADIAQHIPSRVLADLFHIDEADRPNFYRWSNNMTQFFGGASKYRNEDGIEVNHSAKSIRDYLSGLVESRRANPGDDFLGKLIRHQAELGLHDDELVAQAVMMLVAGQVTTTDQFCNNLYTLFTTEGALEELSARPEILPTALEELNRLDPAVNFIFRLVRTETRLAGVRLPPGAVIFISAHAANRDPAVFGRPDDCVLDRTPNPHLAYGHGAHFCLGAKLARLQMRECFSQMLKRSQLVPDLTRAVRKHHSLAFSGFESIPVRVESSFYPAP